jgi:tRNA threonylcarbamoyl adenosine modification protein YeaZ
VLLLVIDTATPAVTAAVVERGDSDVRVLAERVTVDPRAHAELLTLHVQEVLAGSPGGPAAIVVGAGPGPFTGLRVGMATAGALGHAMGLPVYPVCSLDAIAAAVPVAAGEPLLVATDARRKELYWGLYCRTRRCRGPEVGAPAEAGRAASEAGALRAAGAGASLYPEILDMPLVEPRYPTPAGLALAAELDTAPGVLTPHYLRRPDAAEPAAPKRVSPA